MEPIALAVMVSVIIVVVAVTTKFIVTVICLCPPAGSWGLVFTCNWTYNLT